MSYVIDRRLNGKNKSTVNRQRFLRRHRVEHDDERAEPVEHPLQQHAQERKDRCDRQVPIGLECGRADAEQNVTKNTAAESDDNSDQRDPEQVEAPVLKTAGEHRTLDGTDCHGREVDPERNGEERVGHLLLVPRRNAAFGARFTQRSRPAPRGIPQRSAAHMHRREPGCRQPRTRRTFCRADAAARPVCASPSIAPRSRRGLATIGFQGRRYRRRDLSGQPPPGCRPGN